jgi:parallel beta helix pectate lyase-like protein
MGCIEIRASNVVIKNSLINGPCFFGVTVTSGSVTVQDTEINCTDGHGTGVDGPNFAVIRVYVHDCENGAEINDNSSMVDSYISSREADTSGHGDGIQSQGGNNVVIRHNTFASLNPVTSSIITNPTLNNNWLIEDNFLSAGAYTLYCPEQGTNFTVRNNRFYPWLAPDGTHLYQEDANGVPLPGTDRHAAGAGLTDACDHTGINWSGNYLDRDLSTVASNA